MKRIARLIVPEDMKASRIEKLRKLERLRKYAIVGIFCGILVLVKAGYGFYNLLQPEEKEPRAFSIPLLGPKDSGESSGGGGYEVIPEPATLVLIGACGGLVGLLDNRRRRR